MISYNITNEHKAWLDIFTEMEEVFECKRKFLNSDKCRRLFLLIERWAYADRMRRQELDNPEEFKGCLWNGEDLE